MIESREPPLKPDNGVSAQLIVRELRRKIVKGEWVPGDQLPTRSGIENQFGASRVTVQRALDELRREEWVVVKGRQGTYVSPQPPHLTRYALVLPNPSLLLAKAQEGSSFWRALHGEAGLMAASLGISISSYFGVDGHSDSEDFQRLVREVRGHRVAGLFFASPPHLLLGTPLMDEPNVPRVAIMSVNKVPGVAAINLDRESFWTRALDYVALRGRRRVAFLTSPRSTPASFPDLLAQRGLTSHPYWHLLSNPGTPEIGQSAIHLLMHTGQHERPDALIISDDNLVEHAGRGLLAAGAVVPRDIEVVAHCNFPHPTFSPVPVKRLGFDVRRVLELSMASLNQQRRGHSVANSTDVAAIFDDEIKALTSSDVAVGIQSSL